MPREEPSRDGPPGPGGDFRWQAFFHKSSEPLFLLNRRRRLLFVNQAWESLAGVSAAEARGLVCRRARPAGPQDAWEDILAHALCPPPEVLQGATGRTRRLLPGRDPRRRWWDVDFFPLGSGASLQGILGRIRVVASEDPGPAPPLPERLTHLRERVVQRHSPDLLEGTHPALARLAEQVCLASLVATPVLLVGEPGSGKRTLARLLHFQGPDRERPFAALDCARLPPRAVARVLFHPDDSGRPGVLYLADPFHLPREVQALLATQLQTQRNQSGEAGGAPRILAGCSRDPRAEIRAGRFLEELYFTLGTLVLEIPPLRERKRDLPRLVERLLNRVQTEGGMRTLSPDAWEVVLGHNWPGNLAELHEVLDAACRHAGPGDRIVAEDLPASLRRAQTLGQTPGRLPEQPLPLDQLLAEAERRLIQLALRRSKGHKARAAAMLEIDSHRLWRRMKTLGLTETERPGPDPPPPEASAGDPGR